jgi:hypothetical protein
MVTPENGAGRGLFGQTLSLLFGEDYVITVPYAKMSGGEGSRFNAELADKLVVLINEARDADDRKFSHRNAAREAIKDFIEPNHEVPVRIEGKGKDAVYIRSAASTIVNSNNLDAMPINEHDRRMAVVRNGGQMSEDDKEAYRTWMHDPANIGALYRHLKLLKIPTDKNVFNPYMAPRFSGRELMIEAGKSELDLAWEEAVRRIATASDLYTMSQVVRLTRIAAKANSRGSDYDEIIRKHTRIHGHRIGTKDSPQWRVRYGTGEDNREPIYAVDTKAEKRFARAELGDIKREVDKTQQLVEHPGKPFNKLLHAVAGGEGDSETQET